VSTSIFYLHDRKSEDYLVSISPYSNIDANLQATVFIDIFHQNIQQAKNCKIFRQNTLINLNKLYAP